MPLNVILDTNHWITLERDPGEFQRYREAKREHGFTVAFTRGNFIDLAKRAEQDTLSGIIAAVTDAYVVVDTYNADEYTRSKDPLVLAPPDTRDFHAEHTEDFDDTKTLRFMFRILDQDPDPEYDSLTETLKEIYEAGGESWLTHTLFQKYSNWEGETIRTEPSDAHKLEYVRLQLIAEHVMQLKDEEKISTSDYVDMKICAYAVFTSDVFLAEKKWANADIVPRIFDGIEGGEPPVVVADFGEFYAELESTQQ